MFYDNPSPIGQHVNIKIKNVEDLIAIVGENETDEIHVFNHTKSEKTGFVGYIVFSK